MIATCFNGSGSTAVLSVDGFRSDFRCLINCLYGSARHDVLAPPYCAQVPLAKLNLAFDARQGSKSWPFYTEQPGRPFQKPRGCGRIQKSIELPLTNSVIPYMVLLRPTYLINGDVTDIDLRRLQSDGIKGLIFDLDSTLLAPHSGKLTIEVAGWLEFARANFKVAIVSNNKRLQYLEEVKVLLDMPIMIGRASKPRRRAFLEVLKAFDMNAHEIAVIGDRPLTDVLGGQRAGMKTVLVWPLKTQVEPHWVKMMRKLERCVIRP